MQHDALKRKEADVTGEALVPMITGKAFTHYTGRESMIGFVERKTVNQQTVRTIRFRGSETILTKSRYASLLATEPAHFGPIKKKILGEL